MHKTKIVTSFLKNSNKILLLKRSEEVKSMKNLWAGISGIIEGEEKPLDRAKIEIFEEVGISEEHITLIKSTKEFTIESPQYKNQEWIIFPFFFKTDTNNIKLNWENSDFRWIEVNQLKEFNTVPSLEEILLGLL